MAGRAPLLKPEEHSCRPGGFESDMPNMLPSSMTGQDSSDAILSFGQRSGVWSPAVHPLHADKPEKAGIGPGITFAQHVRNARPHAQILLVPCAWGGSELARWRADSGDLFRECMQRTRAALSDARASAIDSTSAIQVSGILWHQGESDSGSVETSSVYDVAAASALQSLRESLGSPLAPVIVGELGYFLDQRKDARFRHASAVNAALVSRLPATLPRCACVSAHGLGHVGDALHFDAHAQATLGRRYALAWLALDGGGGGQLDASATVDADAQDGVPFSFPSYDENVQLEQTGPRAIMD